MRFCQLSIFWISITTFSLGLVTSGFSQLDDEINITLEGDTLHDPPPMNMSSEYEMIILNGDTVLRSTISKEIYNRNFVKLNPHGQPLVKKDHINSHWDTSVINPYKDVKAQYPFKLDFSGQKFTLPVDGPVTSRYGWRRGRAHKGIDIDLRTGDNVRVAMDGKVRYAKYNGGLGKVVVVRHYNGLETFYAHLSKILVKPGDYVYSGQVIGKGGNTGRSRGSHLHFEARYMNQAINPEYLFGLAEKTGIRSSTIYVDNRWTDPRKHRSYKQSAIAVRTQPLMAENSIQKTTQSEPIIRSDSRQGIIKTNKPSTSMVKEKVHVVTKGDTLAKIASVYGKSIDAICKVNGISKSSVLSIGQRLIIK